MDENILTEKKVKLKGIDLLAFYGLQDANLQRLEEILDAQIIARGNELILRGNREQVDQAERIVTELVFMQNKNGVITFDYIEPLARLTDWRDGKSTPSAEKISGADDIDSVVLFTKRSAIKPRTPGQARYVESTRKNDIVFSIGPAGTGKTFLAVAIAVASLRDKEVDRIILSRPAVEAGESLGFLPGDFREKIDPYLRPLYDALHDMVPLDKLKRQIETRIIEIVPLAYMRGRTLNNSFVILDEAQNTTPMQMKMFLTRLGGNSKAIITGDITQIDLPAKTESGLIQVRSILKGIEGIDFVYLTEKDVARHKLVRQIISAYERFDHVEDGS